MRFLFVLVFLLLGLTISFGQTRVQVIAEKANLRSSPSASATIVATVKQDEFFEVIESQGAWFKVKTPTHVGWIHGNAVQTVDPLTLKAPQTEDAPKLIDKKYSQWGDPNSKYGDLSSSPGTGGGMGTGRGQGSGTGTGTGTGPGGSTGTVATQQGIVPKDPNPPRNAALRIFYKPKGTYTDLARNNNVQGTVKIKVTFLSSGQIGAVVPITSLPHGLTEQAMAAAKQIRFEPKRVNGVPKTTVHMIEYTFRIY